MVLERLRSPRKTRSLPLPRRAFADHLNLGCGDRHHPGWTNVDLRPVHSEVLALDVTQPLPFEEGKFAVVYHSHLLEHLPRVQAAAFLKECRRLLRPDGILRVVVPDLEQIADLYVQTMEQAWQGSASAQGRHEWLTLELLDQMVREQPGGAMLEYLADLPEGQRGFVLDRLGVEGGKLCAAVGTPRPTGRNRWMWKERLRGWLCGSWRERLIRWLLGPEYVLLQTARFRRSGEVHRWMYDRVSLRQLLRATGFTDIHLVDPTESAIPDWTSFHLDTLADGSITKPDSLYMEARV